MSKEGSEGMRRACTSRCIHWGEKEDVEHATMLWRMKRKLRTPDLFPGSTVIDDTVDQPPFLLAEALHL